jgi:hypothetical protein
VGLESACYVGAPLQGNRKGIRKQYALNATGFLQAQLHRARNPRIHGAHILGEAACSLLGVTPDWVRFVADVLHKLHREPNGRFSGKDLERFAKEDWYLLMGKRFIQRNERVLKRKRAKAAQEVPLTRVGEILLS